MLAEQTEIINLTPSAVQAVRDLLVKRELNSSEFALRVFVSGGGCSGMQYGMALESNVRATDLSCEFDGIKVVVDEVSIDYMRGATVDFVDDVMGSGFKIDNPNAVASCGCGHSFRTNNEAGAQSAGTGCNSCA
jgi:iron-sulfur cluster assembly protein